MAELLNVSKNELNDKEMLEIYDREMEDYMEGRDRTIGVTAFEALAVEAYTIEAVHYTGASAHTGPNNQGHTDDTYADVAPGV
jgi:hypothetical protein